jgi:hypothetical protein
MTCLVTVHLWQVPPHRVPAALLAIPGDRRRVRNSSGATFAKLLGTSRGFTLRETDLTRWLLIASWTSRASADGFEHSAVASRWRNRSEQSWRAVLRPIGCRGRWSGRTPFRVEEDPAWSGPVAAVTHARIAPRRLAAFWRAVPPVAADLGGTVAVLAALGFGEAPLVVQGTFSLWSSAAALDQFAYAGDPHAEVIARTAQLGWYAEQLFARFAVVESCGTIDGCDPLNRE